MTIRALVAGTAVAFSLFLTTAGVTTAQNKTLKWVGCGITRKAFMTTLAKEWEAKSGVKILTEGGGATRGIRDVAAGKADLGGTCRHKIKAVTEEGAKLHPIGWDALVVITNPKNPVKSISFDQIRGLMSGKIKNWKALGGPDQAIEVYTRKSLTSGVGLMSRELIFWDSNMKFTGSTQQFKSSGPLEKGVEKNQWAVAITGISSAKKRKVRVLKVNGKDPTVANIVIGGYPIARPLYLVSASQPSTDVEAFLAWAKGEGQKHVAGEGTVTLAQGGKLWAKYNKLIKISRMKARAARPGK